MNTTTREFEQGDIVYVVDNNHIPIGSEIWGNRPAVIVSNDTTSKLCKYVNIVYLTSTTTMSHMNNPFYISVPTKQISEKYDKSIVICDQITTIDKSRILKYVGHIDNNSLNIIRDTIAVVLNIDKRRYNTMLKKLEYNIRNSSEYLQSIDNTQDVASSEVIETLTKQLKISEMEREAFKNLYVATKEKLEAISPS